MPTRLLSSGGPNTLVGLGGDDLYYVNNAADVVIEAAERGFRFGDDFAELYLSPANVEALYLTGSGLTGTGNSGANTLVTTGANTLVWRRRQRHLRVLRRQRQRRDRCRLQPRPGDRVGFPGVQRLRHRGAGRDLHARSAPPTSGRSIPASMPTTRRSRSRTTPRCMPGISCSCEAAPAPATDMHLVLRTRTRRGARDRSAGGRTPSMTATPSPHPSPNAESEPMSPRPEA